MTDAVQDINNPLYKKIRPKAQIFFDYRGSIEQGDVLNVSENHEGQKVVDLVWLEGYKTRNETIALTEVLVVVDIKDGHLIDVPGWSITGHLLPAGHQWLAEHASAK